MDLGASIKYRALELNGAVLGTGRVLRGLTVEHADYSNVPAVGYTEKRAGADGMHASDVYLGGRTLDMHGLIYATSLAEMFDFLHTARSVLSPTSAYQESPGDKGFLPMTFSQPTLDLQSFPTGVVPLFMNVRPTENVRFAVDSNRQTRRNEKGPAATVWAARLLAKDPRVYVSPEQTVDISGAPFTNVAGQAINRGDYETPFNVMLVIGAAVPAVGTFHLVGLNNVDMTIKIEAKANVIYRWFGDDRVLRTQDTTGGVMTNPLALRMDLVTFATVNRRPSVPASINPPARPFTVSYVRSCTVALASGSRLFWSEAFA